MDILLTGGIGYIDRYLGLALTEDRHHLTVSSGTPERGGEICGKNARESDLWKVAKRIECLTAETILLLLF